MKPVPLELRLKGRLWGVAATAALLPAAVLAIRSGGNTGEDPLPGDPAPNAGHGSASSRAADLPNPGFASMESVLVDTAVANATAAGEAQQLADNAAIEIPVRSVTNSPHRPAPKAVPMKAQEVALSGGDATAPTFDQPDAEIDTVPPDEVSSDTGGIELADASDVHSLKALCGNEEDQATLESLDGDGAVPALAEDDDFLGITADELPCPAFGLEPAIQ